MSQKPRVKNVPRVVPCKLISYVFIFLRSNPDGLPASMSRLYGADVADVAEEAVLVRHRVTSIIAHCLLTRLTICSLSRSICIMMVIQNHHDARQGPVPPLMQLNLTSPEAAGRSFRHFISLDVLWFHQQSEHEIAGPAPGT